MAKKTKQLEQLRQAEAQERTAAREAELRSQHATAKVAELREARVQAVADGSNVKAATEAHRKAEEEAGDLAIAVEGANRRVERATRERQQFEEQHAEQLIAELTPQADAAVDRLVRGRAELIEGDREWKAVAQRVNELLAQMGGVARTDAPSGHGLESLVHDLRRGGDGMTSPLPHWRGRTAHEQSQSATAAVLRLRRGEKAENKEQNAA